MTRATRLPNHRSHDSQFRNDGLLGRRHAVGQESPSPTDVHSAHADKHV